MLKLYGFSVSNYYNMVKHTLLYKGIPFEEVKVYPREEAYLSKSPMGKIPCIETEHGFLTETNVILDYIEEQYADVPSLFPKDPYQRAKVRELNKVAELYIELSARRLLLPMLTNQPILEKDKEDVKPIMEKGLVALKALASFSPYVAGSELSAADIYLRYTLAIAKLVAGSQYQWDLTEGYPELVQWEAMMAESPISQQLDQEQAAEMEVFMEYISKNLAS